MVCCSWASSPRIVKALVVFALMFIMCLAAQAADRILIVTTSWGYTSALMYPRWNGEYIAADLTAAGLPFDVVTYSRFVNMSLDGYDIIFLSGHTTPTPVSSVASKCQAAKSAGKKIFINGFHPCTRLDSQGNVVEQIRYVDTLFGVTSRGATVSGVPTVPPEIEKDPEITAISIPASYVRYFTCPSPPAMAITIGDKIIGFLNSDGGTIDSNCYYALELLDYGRVACYLRYGTPTVLGFANDRDQGLPIVSIENHCDRTKSIPAIDDMNNMAADLQIPLVNLLVYDRLTPEAIAKWNSIANPYMTIGSHTKSHPSDWTKVPDVLLESKTALELQRAVIPATGSFFNFSGPMNLTRQQLEQIYSAGVLFGGAGSSARRLQLPNGEWKYIQMCPTYSPWFHYAAESSVLPVLLSQTCVDELTRWGQGISWLDEVKNAFRGNLRYGMYHYAYIHDTSFDPEVGRTLNGLPLSTHVRWGLEYLRSQNVRFLFTDDLITRLRDFVAGSVTCAWNPDGSVDLTVTRPGAKVNEVKVGFKNDLTPRATGSSILSQRIAGSCLYVTLKPEVSSTIHVEWSLQPPPSPPVTVESNFISNASTVTYELPIPLRAAEYQYAVGTSPGGTDALSWTSSGQAKSSTLGAVVLQHGQTYYVSARARFADSEWSNAGSSPPVVADMTAPSAPQVTATCQFNFEGSTIQASWTSTDAESGVVQYRYAIGSTPGGADILNWQLTTSTTASLQGVFLAVGNTYYVSVQARNAANLWSDIGSDDFRLIPDEVPVGMSRLFHTGALLVLETSCVTSVFPGGFYVESWDRSAGIRVVSASSVLEGDLADVIGTIEFDGLEWYVNAQSVQVVGRGSVRPLFMTNKWVGIRGSSGQTGPPRQGVSTCGLLVSTTGRVTNTGPGCIYVHDGSLGLGTPADYGLKVLITDTSGLSVGDFVMVTGVSSVEPYGTGVRAVVRTRRPSDVTKIQ